MLYAVLRGKSGEPEIRTINLTATNWDWKTVKLDLTNQPSSPPPQDGNGIVPGPVMKGGLSKGVVAAIVVIGVLVVLAVFALVWKRRRDSKKAGLGQAEKGAPGSTTVIVSPPPLSPAPTNYPPAYGTPMPVAAVPLSPAGPLISGPLMMPGQPGAVNPMIPPVTQGMPPAGVQGGPMPPVSRDWSNGTLIPDSIPPSQQPQKQQQQFQPRVHPAYPSTQQAAAVVGSAPTSSTIASSLNSGPLVMGDKQELDENNNLASTPTSGSHLQPTAPTAPTTPTAPVASSSTAAGRGPDPRLYSPALANAQLILQQSQTPDARRQDGRPNGGYR